VQYTGSESGQKGVHIDQLKNFLKKIQA